MEHLFPFLLFSFSFILFLSQFLKVGKRFKVTAKAQNNLPPGPWKLPIIGSIHHLITTLPHHRLRELAQTYGPVMHLKLGEVSTIVVSSPEVAREVLKTYDAIFAQRPHQVGADIMCYGSTDIATTPYGGYWKQLRRICSLELLGPKRVRSFQSIREQEVSNLIRYISNNIGCSVNLSEKVAFMTSAIIARAAFGRTCKDQQVFISLIKKLVRMAEGLIVLDLFPSQKWLHLISGTKPKLEELHRNFDIILENIIREVVTEKGSEGDQVEGLLSVLLNIKDYDDALEYPLTIDNIKAVIFVSILLSSLHF
ncbi:Cytochrome P450 [Sesbania bispinosa]|nr:Cytochrome P450 [Sesbania bispinosa]